MKLTEGLFSYLWKNPYENNCNSYLVQGDRTILIDPGHSHFTDQLFKEMRADGFLPDHVDLILTTHCHPDHMEGLEAFLDTRAKMAMSQEEERYLLRSGKTLFELMGRPLPRYRIDFFLKEGELQVGREVFEIYQTPGHSPGSLSIYWKARKALFTGDVVFYGGIGRTDFPEGNSKLLLQSIERLSQLDTELLLPGHGEIVMRRDTVLQNFESVRQNFCGYL
jgi:glyoxylase-like metal-dependent hydrolase (beta-lactamase superfamily II)